MSTLSGTAATVAGTAGPGSRPEPRPAITEERPRTFCQAFQRIATVEPHAVALRTVGGTHTLTWREYAAEVRAAAAGLSALGVGRGDTVALMMANRVEFYPLEVGAQHLGATSFSVYNTLPADQLAHVLSNARAKVVLCEAQYVERIRQSGAAVEHIVCVDGAPEGTVSVEDLVRGGSPGFDFEAAWRAVRPEDVLTLIYTSGTTGEPKGVEMTHENLLFEVYAVAEVLPVRFGDRTTSFLPSAHIADRVAALYFQETMGTQITVVPDARQIGVALADCRPTIWASVPRVWEKLKAGILASVAAEQDEARRQGLQWALGVAGRKADADLTGAPVPAPLAAEYAQADERVLSALRAKLGLDRLRWAVSGAAPIPKEVLAFFGGLGVPICEVWGMSELSCVATVASPAEHRLGTVGRLLPGMRGKIAADGEFLVRGPLVMKGYRGEPAKTAEAVDEDGWLHTGDVMTVDEDGYLTVVDRKKELIINAAGKNMSPARIENVMKAASPLIGGIATIGDRRPYNTALVVLGEEAAAAYAARRGLVGVSAEMLAADAEIVRLITAGIGEGNAKLSRTEQIKRFRVLPVFWEPGGDELTLTSKLRRKPVALKYAAEIDALYADSPEAGVLEPAAS
ncbi:fatty-acid--CoA ligase [Amycolatopsis sp. NBRC 101858]|uniref:fatty acid--CoA ligase FadD11 n=1 Tax=Amycolatopsis sp. NBRC 101858 TaxID=3032200 RepID=UPI0024A2F9CA|nr:fatty acid--CoA ligase FadD11 [Amycolatopsis sp. NBRC 101858]GLY42729.1 fatty-acid--CoA ligase [Amycolatopsis sp. NBRC 101858]